MVCLRLHQRWGLSKLIQQFSQVPGQCIFYVMMHRLFMPTTHRGIRDTKPEASLLPELAERHWKSLGWGVGIQSAPWRPQHVNRRKARSTKGSRSPAATATATTSLNWTHTVFPTTFFMGSGLSSLWRGLTTCFQKKPQGWPGHKTPDSPFPTVPPHSVTLCSPGRGGKWGLLTQPASA